MKKINAKLYKPAQWATLPLSLRKRYSEVDKRLQAIAGQAQPTYADLAHFVFQRYRKTVVRTAVMQAIDKRPSRTHTMTAELACFNKTYAGYSCFEHASLYEAALALRRNLFNASEPLRDYNMTIIFHKWMRILPPQPEDPLFAPLDSHRVGPPLFGALNIYLILLTAHPYSDGNGRTARMMFNLHFAQARGSCGHYFPIKEMTCATKGLYEEYIAQACLHGDFRQLSWHLLDLFEAYAVFVDSLHTAQLTSDIDNAMELIESTVEPDDINSAPPYLISIANLVEQASRRELNQLFVRGLTQAVKALAYYGEIRYAITGMADIVSQLTPRSDTVVFFISATRKQELTMHFRELNSTFRKVINVQVVVLENDAVREAKLLATTIARYGGRDPDQLRWPVLLYDFDKLSPAIASASISAMT